MEIEGTRLKTGDRGEIASLKKTVNCLLFLVVVCLGVSIAALVLFLVHDADHDDSAAHQTNILLSSFGPNTTGHPEGYAFGGSVFKGSGEWAAKPSMPNGLSDFVAVAAMAGGHEKIFLLGGQNSTGSYVNDVTLFDPLTGSYEAVAPMPLPRVRFGAAAVEGKLVVVGGFTNATAGIATDSTLIYDIAEDEWSVGPSTAVKHGDTCAVGIDNNVFVVGGYDTEGFWDRLASVEKLDMSVNEALRQWEAVADIPSPRGDVACANLEGHVAVLGGWNAIWSEPLATFETYDPSTDEWTTRPDMPNPRGDKGVTVMSNGRLLAISGEKAERGVTQFPIHEVDMYSLEANTWTEVAPIPTARFRFASATVDDVVFAFGGHDVCSTVYGDDGSVVEDTCAATATTSVEAYLTTQHEPLFYYIKEL